MDTSHLASLAIFRALAYAAFGRRRDALFELCDTLLTTGPVPSLPVLSIQPQHQRRWGSLYDALAVGQISSPAVEQLLTSHPLAGGESIYAVDASVWPRCDAETSPERGMYYHSSTPRAIQWGNLSSPAGPIPGSRRSASPERAGLHPCECGGCVHKRMPMRWPPSRSRHSSHTCLLRAPCHSSSSMLATIRSSLPKPWVRLQLPSSSACGRGAASTPTPISQPRTGRPRRHGHKFVCDAPATWPTPVDDLTVEDGQYGTVRVRAWIGLHPKTHGVHAKRDARGRRPIVRGTLLLVEVSRLPGQTRAPQALWLWWHTPGDPGSIPDLDRAWRAYVRRFDLEIVCTQMTKTHVLAGGRRRDDVADLHIAVRDDYPVNQQLDELALLLEGGVV